MRVFMDPISQFSYDFRKFVYQDPNVQIVHQVIEPKPFTLNSPEKSSRTKKDLKKQREHDDNEKEKKNKNPFNL